MNEPSYRQPVPPHSRADYILCAALTLVALISFDISGRIPSFSGVGKLICVVLLVAAIQIANQFLLCDRILHYENGRLIPIQRQGKKEKRMGDLLISPESRLFSLEEWKRMKKDYPTKNRLNFCHHLLSREKWVLYVSSDQGEGAVLFFQPDSTLLALLQQKMKKDGASPQEEL